MENLFTHKKRTIFKLLFSFVFLLTVLTPTFPIVAEEQGTDRVYNLQVDIPGINSQSISMSEPGKAIGNYISSIYDYALGIVGILAALVVMFGGVIWLTAGGNTNRIESAKAWITAALTGLVIALSSYAILYTINPDLVNLQISKEITPYKGEEIDRLSLNCKWTETPENKNCYETLGTGWINMDETNCDGDPENFSEECCCKKTTPAEICEDECGGKEYQWDAEKQECNCYGEDTHMACQATGSLTGDSTVECVEVNCPGEDECTSNSQCMAQQQGCCLSDYGYIPTIGYHSCKEIQRSECDGEFYPNANCNDSWGVNWTCN
jgi:hypothetical protein